MKKEYSISFNDAIEFSMSSTTLFPSRPGIYLIRETLIKDGRWIPDLVYIGKAEDLNARLNDSEHDGVNAAKESCKTTNKVITIAYSIVDSDLDRIEACLIYVNKPKYNTLGIDSFNFDETLVKVSGDRMTGLKESNTAVKS